MVKISTVNQYLKELLDPRDMPDYGINGIQVDNDEIEINKIGFAVDASLQSIEACIKNQCDLLVVHHGFFWGRPLPITGTFKKRVEGLIKNNIGLIAYHLPLDAHPEYGNNSQILKFIGIEELAPFAFEKGNNIGWQGELKTPYTIEEINQRLKIDKYPYHYLDFGKKKIKKIAVVSGGGGRYFEEAINEKADLYITGDAQHQLFHPCKENSMNLLFAGHYFTEIFGLKAIQKILEIKFKVKTQFFELPTGL